MSLSASDVTIFPSCPDSARDTVNGNNAMREPKLVTISDVLYWAYANLGMAQNAVYQQAAKYTQLHYIIRNKLWSGFRKGTLQPASGDKDFRSKARHAAQCVYCGRGGRRSILTVFSPGALGLNQCNPRETCAKRRGEGNEVGWGAGAGAPLGGEKRWGLMVSSRPSPACALTNHADTDSKH